MLLQKSDLDAKNAGRGDHWMQRLLEGGKQPFHKRIAAVRFFEHAQPQQHMIMMRDVESLGVPLAGP